jgi:Nif-specific regulatory protein
MLAGIKPGDAAARSTAPPASRGGHLATLLEISEILASEPDLRPALERVLRRLERDASVVRGAVLLLDGDAAELRVLVSIGLGAEAHRVRCRLGQGVAGSVVESGRPVAEAQVGREPLFRRAPPPQRQSDGTFLCLPIAHGRRPTGALAIELAVGEMTDREEARRFFALIAGMIAQALRQKRDAPVSESEPGESGLSSIVGVSAPMCRLCEEVAKVASTAATVLIRGEPGTGKELIARAIHAGSLRASNLFVEVSVGAAPDRAIESELFGHEKGAFAGATACKRGSLELAAGGTLFLDEVAELGSSAQLKLFRLLREGEFERLGGSHLLSADVRLIAASTADLEAAVAAGELREDLHRELSACSLFVPPLRARHSDILMLADHFLARYARAHGKRIRRIAAPAMDMLMGYRWPGNVRELENTIERAVLTCESSAIHGYHLPPALQVAESSQPAARTSLSEAVAQYEKDLIFDALKSARGNRMRAARLLDTTERVIGYKIHKYRIDTQRFRGPGADGERTGKAR